MNQYTLIDIVQLPAILGSVDQWKIGYKQGYDDGKWNKAHNEDFMSDDVEEFCSHHTHEWCNGYKVGYKAGFEILGIF